MTRAALPHRRPHTVVTLNAGNQKFHLGYGHDETGAVKEVFADARHIGSDLQAMLSDACIMCSLLAQHGMSFGDIANALHENRPEGAAAGVPASVIGLIVQTGARIEKEY